MRIRCPHCGSDDVRSRSPMRLWERVASLVLWRSFVCWQCMSRFRALLLPFARKEPR